MHVSKMPEGMRQPLRIAAFPGQGDGFLMAGARSLVTTGIRLDVTEFPQGDDQHLRVSGLAANRGGLDEMHANLLDDRPPVDRGTRRSGQGLSPQGPGLPDECGRLAGRTHGD